MAKEKSSDKKVLIAKMDFEINHNEFHRMIKEGDDVSDVPVIYHPNLKTEGVI